MAQCPLLAQSRHRVCAASMSALEVKRTKVYGDLNFVTDLAKQFSLSVAAPVGGDQFGTTQIFVRESRVTQWLILIRGIKMPR